MTEGPEYRERHGLKPSLAVIEQIEHLKKKGVTFNLCTEEQAAEYLHTANNLLRTSSYRKLYPTKAKRSRPSSISSSNSLTSGRRSTHNAVTFKTFGFVGAEPPSGSAPFF